MMLKENNFLLPGGPFGGIAIILNQLFRYVNNKITILFFLLIILLSFLMVLVIRYADLLFLRPFWLSFHQSVI